MDIDGQLIFERFMLLSCAYLLALPIAWNRERHSRSAGLRTYPLVAIGACGFFIVGQSFLDDNDSNARLIQGLMGGLGFLGGGAILKTEGNVSGMATAASIWITGVIGMSVALMHFEIAVVLSALSFFTLRFGWEAKKAVGKADEVEQED